MDASQAGAGRSQGQVLRARAEFANYQKRAKQQADSDRVYAVGTLARDLLDPLDNLERAIDALRASARKASRRGSTWFSGNCARCWPSTASSRSRRMGRPFDPNLHDAVLQQPSNEHPEGTVVTELSKGYKIRERVLRPSKVAVSTKPAGGVTRSGGRPLRCPFLRTYPEGRAATRPAIPSL